MTHLGVGYTNFPTNLSPKLCIVITAGALGQSGDTEKRYPIHLIKQLAIFNFCLCQIFIYARVKLVNTTFAR